MIESVKLEKLHSHRLPMGVLGGAISPGGESVAAACMNGVFRCDLEDGKHKRLYEHGNYVTSAEWLSETEVLSASYDGKLIRFDLAEENTHYEKHLHDFWSWDMAVSPDRSLVASVTGQYLAGGYKYEPAAEREPSVCIASTESGEVIHRLQHVPSVQAVAFSGDGKFVAAGNLMGEVRVFSAESGELVSHWTTPDFTSWGIIKSHCYLGGVFALEFTPDGEHLLLAGMGPMRDPMAGNGKQLWQKWKWNQEKPELVDQTHKGDNGEGLMETLAVHPGGEYFAMGGRLRGGDWNVALFRTSDGQRLATLKTGCRVTQALFSANGERLVLLGAQGQPKKKNKDGQFPHFGRVDVYTVA